MTSLTPQRDCLTRTLAAARAASERIPTNGAVDEIERRLCLDLMEAALLPCADLMDLEVSFEDIQSRLENAIANVIVSHSLSLTAGEQEKAKKFARAMLFKLAERVRRGIENRNPAIESQGDVQQQTRGHA